VGGGVYFFLVDGHGLRETFGHFFVFLSLAFFPGFVSPLAEAVSSSAFFFLLRSVDALY